MKTKSDWIINVILVLAVIVLIGSIGVSIYSNTIVAQKMDEFKDECSSLHVENDTLRYLLYCAEDPALLAANIMKTDATLGQNTLGDILGEEWDGTPETATAMLTHNTEYRQQALAVMEQRLLGAKAVYLEPKDYNAGPQSLFDPNNPGYADFGGGPNH